MRNSSWKIFIVNALAVGLAVSLGVCLAQPNQNTNPVAVVRRVDSNSPIEMMEDALPAPVSSRMYQRIISTSIMTDRILLELVEPKRILALSQAVTFPIHLAMRAQGKPLINGLGPIENILALHPDLVLMTSIGSMGYTRQLREAGLMVIELGELHGLRTFRSMVTRLGLLLNESHAAKEYLIDFEGNLERIKLRRGSHRKVPGLYLSTLGGGLQGGTIGTSFHDVLESAGVSDVAANRFQGWPTYTAEILLSLKPQVIVTYEGMGESLCRNQGLYHLPACKGQGAIVELPEALLNDPGALIVEAADRLSQAVFPALSRLK